DTLFFSLRLALCRQRKFRQANCNPSTWRREASISRPATFMLGPKTVTRLMVRRTPGTTRPMPHHRYTHRGMCHRDRSTEHRHTMKGIVPCTPRARPTLTGQTTPTLMRKNFRRDRPLLCHTATVRIAYTTQSMVARHTVISPRCNEGRLLAATKGGSARAV